MVEGVTEFLPVSSTGHLILTARALNMPQTEFLKTFEIAIQLGAILSVVVLYGKKFLVNVEILKRVAAAFFPTALVGFVLYKAIKKFLIGNEQVVLFSLFFGGLALILFEIFYKHKENTVKSLEAISYPQAVGIGLFQSLAMIPGVSRSAATICGGLVLGLERKTIVEFSFLVAVPTMGAAVALDLLKNASSFSGDQMGVLGVGFVLSFLVAMASIRWLLGFIQKHTFTAFGIYRMALASVFWIFFR